MMCTILLTRSCPFLPQQTPLPKLPERLQTPYSPVVAWTESPSCDRLRISALFDRTVLLTSASLGISTGPARQRFLIGLLLAGNFTKDWPLLFLTVTAISRREMKLAVEDHHLCRPPRAVAGLLHLLPNGAGSLSAQERSARTIVVSLFSWRL